MIFSDADAIVLPDAYQYLVEEAITKDSDILVLGGAVALSGIFEILYGKYRVFKDKMLK